MNYINKYFLLFSDTFFANLAINFDQELIYRVMQTVNEQSRWLIILVATLAAMTAYALNYLIGAIIRELLIFFKIPTNLPDFNNKWSRIFGLFLLLSPLDVIGKFIVLTFGIIKYPFFWSLALAGLGKLLFFIFSLHFI